MSKKSWKDYISHIKNPLEYVTENFQEYVVSNLDKIPMAKEIVGSYYCMMDTKVPMHIKLIIAAGLAYIILPLDLIPDLTPIVGYSDDITAFMGVLSIVESHITKEHYQQAQRVFDGLKK